MQTLKELYKIGPGPSSSHTLAPARACRLYLENYPETESVKVNLYGSLSLTGKGHFTDKIIMDTFAPRKCDVDFKLDWEQPFPNGFTIDGYDCNEQLTGHWSVYSLGGGSIFVVERPDLIIQQPYKEKSMSEIIDVCKKNQWNFVDYVFNNEDKELYDYLSKILSAMLESVKRGLNASGVLPGKLGIERCAKNMYLKSKSIEDNHEEFKVRLMSYAYAVSEENASNGEVVTAPTLGACGILAAYMYMMYYDEGISRRKLINALAVGGLFGNVIKHNATISGAVGGCQAEIGAACCMTAAAAAYLNDLNLKQIEYAAEIAMEHHLGLTCDPVGGYVIIPCIERNAVGVLRAVDAMTLSKYMSKIKENVVNFDTVVRTMKYTGQKLPLELKETSLGGLAQEVSIKGVDND